MKKDYSKKGLAIFASYYGPHKKLFIVDMGCAIVVAAIDLLFPWATRLSMETLLPDRLFGTFFLIMGLIIGANVIKAVLYYIITVWGHSLGIHVEADMRRDVFNHIQNLSFSFFDKNRTGVLMSRITNDLFDITELAHHGPEDLLISLLTIAGAIAILFTIQWRLALVLLVLVPLFVLVVALLRRRMMAANIEVKRKTAEINASIESGISGIRTAKAFANEDIEDKKFSRSNDTYVRAKAGYYRSMGLFQGSMEFMTSAMQVVVIAVGGALIMGGRLDYVDLITFTLYVSTFISPIRKLSQFSELYMQGTAGFSRFLEIMRTEPDIKDAPGAVELRDVRGRVDFNGVSFAYDEGSPVLEDVNLHIAPGETLAVVGPSGGGKTTLCQLLPRFYDVTAGSVCIDGRDVRSVTQASLRRNIGIIQQDVFMFAGTVRDNIRYGSPEATDEEIVAAAIRAEIHSEIMDMPQGYDTYIGERGVMLSGGQKQRISIARVFLKNPPVLILDEATSALDSVTEQKIQRSLDELSSGRTCIIIAHRLSTIRSAGRIAVIENERVLEQGSHAELLARGGAFAQLWRAQSGE